MFQDTRRELLGPLHSLLKRPLDFQAVDSIGTRLRSLLDARPDYTELCELARLYDTQRGVVRPRLAALRAKLQDTLSIIVPVGGSVDRVASSRRVTAQGSKDCVELLSLWSHSTVQIQLERLSDELSVADCGSGDPLQDPDLCQALQLMLLGEVLALALGGLARISRQGDGALLIEPSDARALEVLKQVWFARWLDSNSAMSLTMRIAKYTAESGGRSEDLNELLAHAVLDRALTVTWSVLDAEVTSRKSMVFAHNLARLIVHLLARHATGSAFVERASLRKSGFDDVLQSILALQS